MNKLCKTLIIIAVIAGFGFGGYKLAIVFKKEKSKIVLSETVVVVEIKAKVISFKEERESILIKKEDTLENMNILITDKTMILNEEGIILEKNNIELGTRVRIELEEDKEQNRAKKIYILK